MMKQKGLFTLLLMLSGAALVFLTTPAWFSGMAWAALAAVILCVVIWRLSPGEETIRQMLSSSGALCTGLVLTSAFGFNFYHIWEDSGYVQKIAGLMGLPVEGFLGGCAMIGVLVSVPVVTCLLRSGWNLAADAFREKQQQDLTAGTKGFDAKRSLLILFLLYVVGFSAVLRTNFYYMDDNGRAAFGYKTWDYFGRYLSTGFSTLLHGGDYLTDIAPLPQLTALLIMAVAGIMLLYILYDRTRFALWEIVAVVPLGLNPYFLECLSFRFDAPYMAVSVLAGIFPLLYRNRNTWAYLLMSMLGILAVCTSYQPATGIFPILVILLALRMWNKGMSFRETMVFCLRSVAGYLLGLAYFKLVIMKPADAGYVSNALPEASGLLFTVVKNYAIYFGHIVKDFKPFWHLLTVLTTAGTIYLTVHCSRQKKAAALAFSLAALCAMLMLCLGIYPVLASPLYSPRAMYGFGVLLTLLCAVVAEGWGNIPLKLPALLLSWVFFIFSFTYGNALSLQKDYTEFRIQMVMEDLNDLELFREETDVQVCLSGGIGVAPVIENMPQNYQMLNRLVPETFAGGDDLTEYRFYDYYGLHKVAGTGSVEECTPDMPVLKDGIFHTIRGEENRILIQLK